MNSVLTWQDVIGEEKQKGYFKEMMSFVEAEIVWKGGFPPKEVSMPQSHKVRILKL